MAPISLLSPPSNPLPSDCLSQPKQTLKWQQSRPQDPSQPCHLLSLLPELRLQILTLILVRPDPLILTRGLLKQMTLGDRDAMKDELLDRWFTIEDLSIMLTCKQLHAEAASVLYSQNTFLLSDSISIQHRYYCFSQTRNLKPSVQGRYAPLIRHVITRPIHGTKQVLYNTAIEISQLLAKWPGVLSATAVLSAGTLRFLWDLLKVFAESGEAVVRLAVEMRTMLFMQGVELAKVFMLVLKVEDEDKESEGRLREVQLVVNEAVEKAKTMRRRAI